MRNHSLLKFLAAVQMHTDTGTTLMRAAGFDPLELQVATAAAEKAGLVEATGKVQPSLSLTAEGRAWVAEELAPFARLFDVIRPSATTAKDA